MGNQLSNVQVIGIAEQAAQGSPETTPDYYIKYLEGAMPIEMDKTLHREGDNDERPAIAIKNAHRERFSFKFLARPTITAVVYAYHLGKDVATGSSDPYTHTITRSATNGSAWLTISQEYEDGKIKSLSDCKITKVVMDAEVGKGIVLTIEGTGITPAFSSASLTAVYDDEEPFKFYDASGAFTVKGDVQGRISKLSVTSTVVIQELQTDGILLADLPDLKHDVEMSADIFAEDGDTIWKDINYDEENTAQETLRSGNLIVDFTYGATQREFKLTISKIIYEPVALPQKADAEVSPVTIAGVAVVPDSGAYISAICQNDISANLLNNS